MLSFLFVSILVFFTLCQTTYYVDEEDGGGGCTGIGDTCYLATALALADHGDIIDFVGTETQYLDCEYDVTKSLTFTSSEYVTLEGVYDICSPVFDLTGDVEYVNLVDMYFYGIYEGSESMTNLFENGDMINLTIDSCYFQNMWWGNIPGDYSTFETVRITNTDFYNCDKLYFDEINGDLIITDSSFTKSFFDQEVTLWLEVYWMDGTYVLIEDSEFNRGGLLIDGDYIDDPLVIDIIGSDFSHNRQFGSGGALSMTHYGDTDIIVNIDSSTFYANCVSGYGAVMSIASLSEGNDLTIANSDFDCNGRAWETNEFEDSGIEGCPDDETGWCDYPSRGDYFGGSFYLESEKNYSIDIDNTVFSRSGQADYWWWDDANYVFGTLGIGISWSGSGRLGMNEVNMTHHYRGVPIYLSNHMDTDVSITNSNFYQLYGKQFGDDEDSIYWWGEKNKMQVTFPFYFRARNGELNFTSYNSVFDSQSMYDYYSKCSGYEPAPYDEMYLHSGLFYFSPHGYDSDIATHGSATLEKTTILGVYNGDDHAGCIYSGPFTNGFDISILNSHIEGCTTCGNGGAILSETDGSEFFVHNTTFKDHFSYYKGGAISVIGDVETVLTNSTFTDCISMYNGGAIFGSHMQMEIDGCHFENNYAYESGGAVAVEIPSGDRSVSITNTKFYWNAQISEDDAAKGGGALYLEKSSSDISLTEVSAYIDTCDFMGNYAYLDGGQISISSGHTLITNTEFYSGWADRHGGQIYLDEGRVVLEDSEMIYSSAGSDYYSVGEGGAIYSFSERSWDKSIVMIRVEIEGCSSKNYGGCVYMKDTYLIIQDTEISYCETDRHGGCVYMDRSKLYFGNVTEVTSDLLQVCVSDAASGIPRRSYDGGYSRIAHGSATWGGGVYVGENSLIQNYQEVQIDTCVADVGGGIYLASPYFFTGHTFIFEDNYALYGAAIASVPDTPDYRGRTDAEKDMEDDYLNCTVLRNNNGSYSNSVVLFMGNTNETNVVMWGKMQCEDDLGNCTDQFGSSPTKIRRVPPDNWEDGSFIQEDISSYLTAEEIAAYSAVLEWDASTVRVYSEQTFDVVFKILDFREYVIDSFPDFSITMVEEEGAVLITTEDEEKELGSDGVIEFKDLALRGLTGDTSLVDFEFEYFGMTAVHTILVEFTACPAGKEPEYTTSSCNDCSRGYYKFIQGDDKCNECDPFGATCDNNTVTINPGYWSTVDAEDGTVVIYQCIDNYCSGGTIDLTSEDFSRRSIESDDETGLVSETETDDGNVLSTENECLGNRDGRVPLCAGCVEGYTMMSDECKPCQEGGFNAIPFFGIIVLQIALFLYVHTTTSCTSPPPPPKKKKKKKKFDYFEEQKLIKEIEEDAQKNNNSTRLLVDYIQMCFLVNNFGAWLNTADNEAMAGYRDFFVSNLQFLRNLFLFNPSFGGSEIGNDISQCPFRVDGEVVLVWRVLQQFFMLFICLIPFLVTCYFDCNWKLVKCFCCTPIKMLLPSRKSKKVKPNDLLEINSDDEKEEEEEEEEEMDVMNINNDQYQQIQLQQHQATIIMEEDQMLQIEVDPNLHVEENSVRQHVELEKEEKEVVEEVLNINNQQIFVDDQKVEEEEEEVSEEEEDEEVSEDDEIIENEEEQNNIEEENSNNNNNDTTEELSTIFNELLLEEEKSEELFEGGEEVIEPTSSSSSSSSSSSNEEEEEYTKKQQEKTNDNNNKEEEEVDIIGNIINFEELLKLDEEEDKKAQKAMYLRILTTVLCCLPRFLVTCLSFNAFRITLINLVFMMHTPLVMVIFDFLFCTTFSGVGMRMMRYSFIECYTSSYFIYLFVFFLPLLLAGLAFPIVVTCYLCVNQRRLNRPGFRSQYGVLYESYRKECYWYETVIIIEKLLLILSNKIYDYIKINNPTYMGLNHTFHSGIIGGSLLVHQVVQPFASKFENRIQFLNLFSLLMMIAVQEEYYASTSNIGNIASILMFVGLVWVMGCCCFCRMELLEKVVKKVFVFLCCCCGSKCCFANRNKNKNRKNIDQEIQTDDVIFEEKSTIEKHFEDDGDNDDDDDYLGVRKRDSIDDDDNENVVEDDLDYNNVADFVVMNNEESSSTQVTMEKKEI